MLIKFSFKYLCFIKNCKICKKNAKIKQFQVFNRLVNNINIEKNLGLGEGGVAIVI